jgi:hypothetical protein
MVGGQLDGRPNHGAAMIINIEVILEILSILAFLAFLAFWRLVIMARRFQIIVPSAGRAFSLAPCWDLLGWLCLEPAAPVAFLRRRSLFECSTCSTARHGLGPG